MSFNDKFIEYAEECGFNPSLGNEKISVTLTGAEWNALSVIIEIGLLNMTSERREKYDDDYRELFDKLNKQFEPFNEKINNSKKKTKLVNFK